MVSGAAKMTAQEWAEECTDMTLEEEFWADPSNVPAYDDQLMTTYPEGPESEPEEESLRKPLSLPEPSAPMASADPEFRPPRRPPRQQEPDSDSESQGFDIKRALASLLGGSASVDQLDRLRAAQAAVKAKSTSDAQANEFARRRDAREQGKYELDRDIMAPAKAGKLAAESGKINDLRDPKSDFNKSARELAAQRIAMQATRLPDGSQAKTLAMQAIARLRDPESIAAGPAIQNIAKQFGADVSDIMKDAHTKFQEGDAGEKNKQAWARINAARDRAMQPKEPSERVKAAQAKNQDKLDDEVEKAEWAREILLGVAEVKKNVKTGPVEGRAQDVLQKVGLSSADYNKLKSRLTMVSNRIIKELSGSAVTGNEWARMQDELANILDDDENFESKLADMIELAESIKQRAINKYSRSAEGAPVQPSNTARRVTAQEPKTMPGERPPPDATPGNAAQRATAQKIAADPNHPKHAKAVAWLKAHP